MSEKGNAVLEWSNAIPTGRKLVRDGDLRAVDTSKVLTPGRAQRAPGPPVTVEHEYLAAILLELQATNELLAALLAQGEPPPLSDSSGNIELSETKRKRGK